jgi:hypothetical protein
VDDINPERRGKDETDNLQRLGGRKRMKNYVVIVDVRAECESDAKELLEDYTGKETDLNVCKVLETVDFNALIKKIVDYYGDDEKRNYDEYESTYCEGPEKNSIMEKGLKDHIYVWLMRLKELTAVE